MAEYDDDTARSGSSSLEDAVRGGTANYPGYPYVDRVTTAIALAWASQTEQMNNAWSDMRNGRWTFARAMQMWARTIEISYDVFVEAAQGPFSSKRPAWLAIPYDLTKASPKGKSGLPYRVPLDGPSEPRGEVDYSKFIGPSKNEFDLYVSPPMRVENRIEFMLDEDRLQQLKHDTGTEYMSFMYRKGQGAAPPLAIIVLRVIRGAQGLAPTATP